MEREIIDPVGYRYILTITADRLHIRRGKKQGTITLTKNQAEGLKAYLDKALRSRPSSVVEDYEGLILQQDDRTAAIQAAQGSSIVEIYPPSWNPLADELGLMIPYIERGHYTASDLHPDVLH